MAYRKLQHKQPGSFIRQIEYDDNLQRMKINFANGNACIADGVPNAIADMLDNPAASAGQIWHSHLKAPNYTWTDC